MSDILIDLLRSRPDGLVRSRDARAVGLDSRLRRLVGKGVLVQVWPGYYMTSTEWESLDGQGRSLQTMHAVRAARDGRVVFAERSAAAAWGLPLSRIVDRRVVVLAHASSRSRGSLVRIPQTGRSTTSVGVFQVTSAADTLVDLAARVPFPEALMAADHALRAGLCDRDELGRVAAARCSARARIRRIVDSADPLAESPLESLSRARILQARLASPVLQARVCVAGHDYRADFFWPELSLVGECDGRVKYGDDGASAADAVWREKLREDRIRGAGFRVVRWGWREASEPGRLEGVLRGAGVPPLVERVAVREHERPKAAR